MHVLEQHQHRAAPRQRFELLDQRGEDSAALALRITVGRAGEWPSANPKSSANSSTSAAPFRRLRRQQLFELGAPFGGRVVAAKPAACCKLRQDRLQRAALMMRLAEVAQADMRFVA